MAKHLSMRRLATAAWAFTMLVLVSFSAAEVRVVGAGLRFGRSPRLTASDWAYFEYSLDNPDDEQVTVRLTLRADRHQRAVYETVVTLGAGTRINGRSLVTASASENYLLSVFRGDTRIARTGVPSRYTDPPEHVALFFLNDAMEFAGASQLEDSNLLRDTLSVTVSKAARSPDHWAGYGHSTALVVARPAYRDMSALQFAAIIEFVHRGGTLVFADPDGTMDAARTPLRELLPVSPLRVRLTEALPELDAWGAAWRDEVHAEDGAVRSDLVSPDGFRFLESSAVGDGITVLSHGDFPVVRWRTCGLGRVGFVAIDPCHARIRSSGVEVPLWNHILAWSQPPFSMRNYSNSRLLPTVVAQLTGFKIPTVGPIAAVLWGYCGLVVIILVGGYAVGRNVLAWVGAAVAGLLLTGGIFVAASLQNADRAPRSAAILDLRTSTGKRTTGQAVVSLFTKKDIRPTIVDTHPENRIRPLPSPARGKRKEPLEAPLIVRREKGLTSLPDINLQALRPRAFASIHNDTPEPVGEGAALVFGSGRPVLRGAQIPAALDTRGARAYLLASSSLMPLNEQSEGWVMPSASSRLVDFNTFMQRLSRYLVEGGFPDPALVILRPWRSEDSALNVDLAAFEQRGFAVEFLPVSTRVAGASVNVPPEFIALRPAGNVTRMLLQNGEWQSDVLRRRQTVIPVEVVLPLALSDVTLESVTVDLDYSNAGGNVTMTPRLTRIPLSTPSRIAMSEPERAWETATPAAAERNGVFTFNDLGSTPLVQPLYGSFRLLLRAYQDDFVQVGFEADRTNRFRITRLRVSVTGRLDTSASSRRF